MEIVKPPETLEDFKKVRESILDLMANPYCDRNMFSSLKTRLEKLDLKINDLTKNGNTKQTE